MNERSRSKLVPLLALTAGLVIPALLPQSAHGMYDPQHGRWLQRDPAGYVDGMNLYEYVNSKPTIADDPLGLYFGGGGLPKGLREPPPVPWTPQPDPVTLASLTYDVAVAVGATPTWDGVQRALYEAADEKLRAHFDEMVKKGLMTAEDAARQRVDARNDLVIQFRKGQENVSG
jgi:uncharacterized protein RhaS with RHS repeats